MAVKNNSYWARRRKQELEWQLKQLKQDKTFAKQIERRYNSVIRDINDEIEREISSLAIRNKSAYAEAQKAVTFEEIERESELAQRVVSQAEALRADGKTPTYADWSEEVNKRMRIYNATMRINRLEYLKSTIGLQLTANGMELANDLSVKLSKAYREEVLRQAGILGITLPDAKAWINNHTIENVMASVNGGTWSDRLWGNQDALKARLDTVLTTGLLTGDNPRKMARKLKYNVKSTVKNYRYVTERLARTETARLQYEAQMETAKNRGSKYVWYFAEPGACSECAKNARHILKGHEEDGEGIFPIDSAPKIPIHPNCRCSVMGYKLESEFDAELAKLGFGKNKLNLQEERAIKIYISSEAYKLNDSLRRETLSQEQKEIIKHLDNALDKMPVYKGEPLQRDYFFSDQKSLNGFVDKFEIGGMFVDPAYISTSKLHYGKGKETIHVIIKSNKTGRDISEFNTNEQEVLFPRNTHFRVEDAYIDKNGKMTMVWSEMNE